MAVAVVVVVAAAIVEVAGSVMVGSPDSLLILGSGTTPPLPDTRMRE